MQSISPISPEHRPINYKLFAILIISGLLPALYTSVRIYFIGELPNPWAYSLAAQAAWLNIGYEVISEALMLPLLYMLG
ncbi:hypothetical protein NFHSH190041_17110 [Shewanella sp. NFH-SH190041]|nr:hypothetical protein NFHSH190041_17110 [Shewanella sp. NFH-SH190041]